MPENDFFFDYVRLLTDWMNKAMPKRVQGILILNNFIKFLNKFLFN